MAASFSEKYSLANDGEQGSTSSDSRSELVGTGGAASSSKVVAITGASSGMGAAAARLFAQNGWRVFAGARRVDLIPEDAAVVPLRLDVTESESNRAFIAAALAEAGHIDVVINNAGYGEYGPAEQVPMAAVRRQFETNFFGAVELTQLALPGMRERGRGRIVNISSIGGDVYLPMGAYYHASKAALQQWSDVLDLEIRPFGLRSVVVQPGGTKTDWGAIADQNGSQYAAPGAPYARLISATAKAMGRWDPSATADELARVFYAAATDRNPKRRYYHSAGDAAAVRLARSAPGVWNRGVRLIAGRLAKHAAN